MNGDLRFNSSDSKPKTRGVYMVRVMVRHAETNEDAATIMGFAYFDKSIGRWGALRANPLDAAKQKYTCAFHMHTDQRKEWRAI